MEDMTGQQNFSIKSCQELTRSGEREVEVPPIMRDVTGLCVAGEPPTPASSWLDPADPYLFEQ